MKFESSRENVARYVQEQFQPRGTSPSKVMDLSIFVLKSEREALLARGGREFTVQSSMIKNFAREASSNRF